MISMDMRVDRPGFSIESRLACAEKVTGLIGPSGCGKTTLLMALAGLITPSRGKIELDGKEVFFDSDTGVNVPSQRRRVGVVFQDSLLFPHLDVRGNLLFGYRRTAPEQRSQEPVEIYSLLGLEPLLERRVHTLSGGEARRVAIGRALLCSPRLLLLDEPLTGLDGPLRDRVLSYLLRLKDNLPVPIVYVSHSFGDVMAVADSVALIRCEQAGQGARLARVEAAGTPARALPLVRGVAELGNVETFVHGTVEEVRPAEGYSLVRGNGFDMRVGGELMQRGDECYVVIRADELILARGELPPISTRNIWRATVESVEALDGRRLVTLDIGAPVRAVLTPAAVGELGLGPGTSALVIAKANSLRAVVLKSSGGEKK